jgi:hypothetical protein
MSRMEISQQPKFNDLVKLAEVFEKDTYYLLTGNKLPQPPDKYEELNQRVKNLENKTLGRPSGTQEKPAMRTGRGRKAG